MSNVKDRSLANASKPTLPTGSLESILLQELHRDPIGRDVKCVHIVRLGSPVDGVNWRLDPEGIDQANEARADAIERIACLYQRRYDVA